MWANTDNTMPTNFKVGVQYPDVYYDAIDWMPFINMLNYSKRKLVPNKDEQYICTALSHKEG